MLVQNSLSAATFGIYIFFTFYCKLGSLDNRDDFCPWSDREKCGSKISSFTHKYLLYDVNPPEGFNLRRDVYMRLAIFMNNFSKTNPEWHLVLPPWHHLYHWRSKDIGEQTNIPWSHFFDVESMKKFAPVIEFDDFIEDWGDDSLDEVFLLQHYSDAFSANYEFSDKWDFEPCNVKHFYMESKFGWEGWFWGKPHLSAKNFNCISFEGTASGLEGVLKSSSPSRSVVIDRAEVVLHDSFGSKKYWECRRSMRFSKGLRNVADKFRREFLNSTDENDLTILPKDWRNEMVGIRGASGGPYIAVHLRRRDFVTGRIEEAVSLEEAAIQIKVILKELELDTVFVATDASNSEMKELRKFLKGIRMMQFDPSHEQRVHLKDGGVAIVDQIICSHARWFIGTQESTFSFRIQEEREIMGFPIEATFNTLCSSSKSACEHSTHWLIKF